MGIEAATCDPEIPPHEDETHEIEPYIRNRDYKTGFEEQKNKKLDAVINHIIIASGYSIGTDDVNDYMIIDGQGKKSLGENAPDYVTDNNDVKNSLREYNDFNYKKFLTRLLEAEIIGGNYGDIDHKEKLFSGAQKPENEKIRGVLNEMKLLAIKKELNGNSKLEDVGCLKVEHYSGEIIDLDDVAVDDMIDRLKEFTEIADSKFLVDNMLSKELIGRKTYFIKLHEDEIYTVPVNDFIGEYDHREKIDTQLKRGSQSANLLRNGWESFIERGGLDNIRAVLGSFDIPVIIGESNETIKKSDYGSINTELGRVRRGEKKIDEVSIPIALKYLIITRTPFQIGVE